jgi:hypothetical protein
MDVTATWDSDRVEERRKSVRVAFAKINGNSAASTLEGPDGLL